jgi:hypothetical protein
MNTMPPSVFSSQISSRIRCCHPFSYFAVVIGTQKNLAYIDVNTVYRYIAKFQLPKLHNELPKAANLPKDFDSMNAKTSQD